MVQASEYPPPSHDGVFECPVLPARDVVMFPHMLIPLFVGRDRSLLAVEAAEEEDYSLVVVAQRDMEITNPLPNDLHSVGTEITVGRTAGCGRR
ncbi:MAG: Lon protease [Anaerolineales bacterium]|nr:Lon protease [Anaerolineales bacterium]